MIGIAGFEVMLEVMLCQSEVDRGAPIATRGNGQAWKVWFRRQLTLRDLLARQGLVPEEYASHSCRIGRATRLAAMGLLPWATYSTAMQVEIWRLSIVCTGKHGGRRKGIEGTCVGGET